MLEMDSRDEVVMKSENQEASQNLGELGRKTCASGESRQRITVTSDILNTHIVVRFN